MEDWKYENLPEHMRRGVALYIEHGVEPGSFLYWILCNNFVEAARRADNINQLFLFHWAHWLYNYAPIPCWGNEEKVNAWIEKGGLNGKNIT